MYQGIDRYLDLEQIFFEFPLSLQWVTNSAANNNTKLGHLCKALVTIFHSKVAKIFDVFCSYIELLCFLRENCCGYLLGNFRESLGYSNTGHQKVPIGRGPQVCLRTLKALHKTT